MSVNRLIEILAAKTLIKTSRAIQSLNELKGYSSYSAALKKLQKELGDNDEVNHFIAVNEHGKFIPVAVGQKAAQLGLFHRGIFVTN